MCLSIAIHRPDDVLSRGKYLGFEWVTVHNGIGFRCGYVRVPAGHAWHGKHDREIKCVVHGGLSFAEPDESCGKGADDAWWVGFDCMHCCDWPDPSLPVTRRPIKHPTWKDGSIKTQEYVEAECRKLCEQAAVA